jgi:DNA-binding CsgD family transcriptional regulator
MKRAQLESAQPSPSLFERLTTAERRVLKLLSTSMATKEIAQELGVSPRTIEAHRANINSKLGLKGSHSLLRFAISNKEDLDLL